MRSLGQRVHKASQERPAVLGQPDLLGLQAKLVLLDEMETQGLLDARDH